MVADGENRAVSEMDMGQVILVGRCDKDFY